MILIEYKIQKNEKIQKAYPKTKFKGLDFSPSYLKSLKNINKSAFIFVKPQNKLKHQIKK